MKTNSFSADEEELNKRFNKLIKPMFEANIAHMHYLVENHEIKAIIQKARKHLKIPKTGRKPNTPKSYREEMIKQTEEHRYEMPILLYTTSLEERGILHEYVEKIMHDFDVYENFRDSFELYIVHNIITAPTHNIGLHSTIHGDGRSHLPEVHFYRAPYVNDWEVAKLLLERHIRSLPDKFKKSYRGKKNLNEHLKITKEASNRRRASYDETYNITNAEIADEIYADTGKVGTIKKVLSRNKRRIKEVTSRPRWTVHKK